MGSSISPGVINPKDKNYWSILDAVIRLEVAKGHLSWKMTELSRLSGVGRPLIYYYFGNSKKEIVQAALKIIGDEFFGFNEERQALWKTGEVFTAILKTRELIERAPYVPVFYFHWRHQKSEIGSQLQELEQRYLDKLASLLPQQTKIEGEGLFAVIFGLTMLPAISEEALKAVLARFKL